MRVVFTGSADVVNRVVRVSGGAECLRDGCRNIGKATFQKRLSRVFADLC